jgi:hypothetical protein
MKVFARQRFSGRRDPLQDKLRDKQQAQAVRKLHCTLLKAKERYI